MSVEVRPLRDDLPFGVRVSGVTSAQLQDPAVRQQLNDLFEDKGMIVFEDVEPTSRMHVDISNVFGPMKEHPVPSVARVDPNLMPGVIDMRYEGDRVGKIVEIEGRELAQWLPWHFDHCYNDELNRAGVLRALEIPPEGGETGFADGVQLYQSFPTELREKIEGKTIIYTLNVVFEHMRFGRPDSLRVVFTPDSSRKTQDYAQTLSRALHPAVWTRKDGRKVLHVSPWMSAGIEGQETPEGEALLEAVCQEINRRVEPYVHKWKPTDMLIWDNWRMLHSVSGMDPKYSRRMQRTTIKGDYGLGRFENNGAGDRLLSEMTV